MVVLLLSFVVACVFVIGVVFVLFVCCWRCSLFVDGDAFFGACVYV